MAYSNDRRDYHDNNKGYHKNKEYTKPVYVNKKIPLGASAFYDNNLTELYNLLDKIPFDLISVPVTMSKSIVFGQKLSGYVTIGNIVKFNDNEFVISMNEQYADKINAESVIIVNVHKDVNNPDLFTRVNSIYVTKGVSVISSFDDLYDQFNENDEFDGEEDDEPSDTLDEN